MSTARLGRWVELWVVAIQVFVLGMLTMPTAFRAERGVALIALTAIAVVLAFEKWRVHRDIVVIWAASMVVGAFGVFWGLINAAPGALRVTTVFLVWPALYMVFLGLAHDLEMIRRIRSALLLGVALATGMSLIVLSVGAFSYGQGLLRFLAFQGAAFGGYEGFTEINLFNLATVMYGLPFLLGLLLVHRREWKWWRRAGLWLLIVAVLLVAAGSGRRMFWLLVMMTPLLVLGFLQLSAMRLPGLPMVSLSVRIGVIGLAVIAVSTVMLGLQFEVVIEQFVAAFRGQEISSGVRFEQAGALWAAFSQSPLIGQGLGASVGVIRSDEMPWAYELWYLALLMNVGILGILVYVAAVGWMLIKGLALARQDREFAKLFVPLAAATTGFLIMSATNPYLGKFDYLWVIFLPVALINAYLTRRSADA